MKDSSKSPGRNNLSAGRRFAFTIIMLVIAVGIVEAGLRLVHFVMHLGDEKTVVAKMLLSPYKDNDWAEKYFFEMHQRKIQYEPYYGWSQVQYLGDYVNIDSEGLRKTWNPPLVSSSSPETVFVFGGSTIWGTGARDDYSIPSCLSRLLNKSGRQFHVVNYGTTGYVFRQEVMRLMTALWGGHRPDYVIFYDGNNDVYSAYQSGEAGTFQNVARTRERLKVLSSSEHLFTGVKGLLNDHSMIYRAARKTQAMIFRPKSLREAAVGYSEEDLLRLSGDIRESCAQSAELVEHLAEQYDFQYLCFWQPVGFLEDSLNAEERRSDKRLNDRALGSLFRYANDSLPTDRSRHFFNITDVLNSRSGTIYIDFCHISEEGNKMVAEKIASIFEQEILSDE